MNFQTFRLLVGVLVLVGAGALVYGGANGMMDQSPEQGTDPVAVGIAQFGVAAVLLVGFVFSFVIKTRIRRILENIFSIPELVKKLGFTLALLAIYRVGFWIPLPGIDQASLFSAVEQQQGTTFGQALQTVAMFTGGSLQRSSLFGLGIMPYITASIIFQLLGTVVPSIERLQREGEAGRKKIQEYTRYATVVLCLFQSLWILRAYGVYLRGEPGWLVTPMAMLGMTAGTIFMMWLGEQIDEYGVGNGISLLIMAGIVSRMPSAVGTLIQDAELTLLSQNGIGVLQIVILALMFVFVVSGAILVTQGQRRIPIQQAKITRGRRVYGGQRQYLPLRVNHGGVMPIIFASALMMFPTVLFDQLANWQNNSVTRFLAEQFNFGTYLHELLYIAMIFAFAYFWTSVQFKPKEMADHLRDQGSFIPGLRPGRRTAEYLEKVMERITYCGAAFLALIAVLPQVISSALEIPPQVSAFLGGTGLLITVSVTLDLVQRIEAQLVMRNYGGFLGEGARIKGVR